MPIPFMIAGVAVATAGTGIKKGFDAKKKNEKATEIIEEAEKKYNLSLEKFKSKQDAMEEYINDFARFKLMVFNVQIKNLVEFIKKCKKSANSNLDSERIVFTNDELIEFETQVDNAYSLSSGLLKGASSGALTAFGMYGSVGVLGTASTGTAIGTLSGAAATNATLAWLGGGSLAAGGGGMALGSVVLGGMVVAPIIAVVGFFMNSQAEKNLTAAYDYSKSVELEIEKMSLVIEEFVGIRKYIDELGNNIVKISDRFDNILNKIDGCENKKDVEQLLLFGKAIKSYLEIPLLDQDGHKNINFETEMRRISIS